MIYTTLLEPYCYPRILPVEVTILRGARRLRLATPLRRKYSDFVPKIWNILAKLGYQKYLQKIYISMDVEASVTSPYYQLPIVVAVLDAVGMLRLPHNLYCIGRFLADYTLAYPQYTDEKNAEFPTLYTTKLEAGEKIEKYLNHIHTQPIELQTPKFSLSELFPGIIFEGNQINITKSPLFALKRLPDQTLSEAELFVSIKRTPLTSQKLAYLQSITKVRKVKIDSRKCYCDNTPCTCTKAEKTLHRGQLLALKELENNY